ncbi:endonuclease IV [Candidatus Woesearchaeota archaeon]|nr:MAG: endonuclease IV [Candidatus Woesearchaeota archaeon]
MDNVIIGPAGTDGLGYEKGIPNVKNNGLKILEMPFTHGVNVSNEKAKILGELAKEQGVILTIHAPYFINLASPEKIKREASKKRILDSVERAIHLNAKYVVFHPGFYQKQDKEEVYEIIKEEIEDIIQIMEENCWDKKILAPETTGKASQFGDLDELLRLREELGISITVDFSHIYARNIGKIDYGEVFKKLPKTFHAHFSGIEYTDKGERNHILTSKEFAEPLIKKLQEYGDKGYNITIINESPEPLNDAIKMQEWFNK